MSPSQAVRQTPTARCAHLDRTSEPRRRPDSRTATANRCARSPRVRALRHETGQSPPPVAQRSWRRPLHPPQHHTSGRREPPASAPPSASSAVHGPAPRGNPPRSAPSTQARQPRSSAVAAAVRSCRATHKVDVFGSLEVVGHEEPEPAAFDHNTPRRQRPVGRFWRSANDQLPDDPSVDRACVTDRDPISLVNLSTISVFHRRWLEVLREQ